MKSTLLLLPSAVPGQLVRAGVPVRAQDAHAARHRLRAAALHGARRRRHHLQLHLPLPAQDGVLLPRRRDLPPQRRTALRLGDAVRHQ